MMKEVQEMGNSLDKHDMSAELVLIMAGGEGDDEGGAGDGEQPGQARHVR